jgi:hypothetical protein
MNTLIQPDHAVRSVLRSTGVLGLSLALTIGVLVALASVVDGWA